MDFIFLKAFFAALDMFSSSFQEVPNKFPKIYGDVPNSATHLSHMLCPKLWTNQNGSLAPRKKKV